jgi:hypothetical protein
LFPKLCHHRVDPQKNRAILHPRRENLYLCKRVLGYGAQEADQMHHRSIDTVHLMLGLLREEQSFAAKLLREHGIQLAQLREEATRSQQAAEQATGHRREWGKALYELLQALEQSGNISVVAGPTMKNHSPDFAIYANAKEVGSTPQASVPDEVRDLQLRLKSIIRGMEHSIANHEFEKARLYSNEERTVRELLRQLCEKHNLEPAVLTDTLPFLCIEIVREDRFSNMRKRFDDYISAGVAHVWALDFSAERAYTVTAATGLNEFKGDILRITEPAALELDLKRLFAH